MEFPHEIMNIIALGFMAIGLFKLNQYIAGTIIFLSMVIIYHAVLTERTNESSSKEACANIGGKE